MHRRNFLKMTSVAGLSLVTPLSRHAIAGEDLRPFRAPFWITINCAGAWDTTLFCDPKGDVEAEAGKGFINRGYTREDIVQLDVGGTEIPLAPGLYATDDGPVSYYDFTPAGAAEPVHFLHYLAERGVTIINGVDAGLTNHQSGEQLAIAGSTKAGFPTLPAVVAYQRLVDRDDANGPMPLLSFGGYDGTANLLPATRLNKLDVLGKITRPDVLGRGANTKRIHGADTQRLIDEALARRYAEIREPAVRLPSKRAAMSQLFAARSTEQHVGRLLERFDFGEFEGQSSLRKQVYVALRAFEGGLAVSANLVLGGWDTHSNNDVNQGKRYRQLFGALVYLRDQAEQLGIADQVNVVVGSDFGRTPYYNSEGLSGGKDHHSVTSWMSMLWASGVENGLTVIGESDDAVVAAPLADDLSPAAPGEGVIVTPALIHNELRRLAGVDNQPIVDRFGIDAPALRLWA